MAKFCHFCFILLVIFECFSTYLTLKVSFITWNVNDNKRFDSFSNEIVGTLLKLKGNKFDVLKRYFMNYFRDELPDLYAITLQENCLDCSDDNWEKIPIAFISAIKKLENEIYELLMVEGTRKTSKCELIYCHGLHGTTLMFVLARKSVFDQLHHQVFSERVFSCKEGWFGNSEKGIAVVGIKYNEKGICFGGLHFDLTSLLSRQNCFSDTFNKISEGCQIILLGGDFNSRPKEKKTPIGEGFKGGLNQTYLDEMKVTDDLAGAKPFSGPINFLEYIKQTHKIEFFEPLKRQPNFIPTYSIDAGLKCENFPVCYESDRYPSWTDRIIYYPDNLVKCSTYSIVPKLAEFSDHIPVYADCEITL